MRYLTILLLFLSLSAAGGASGSRNEADEDYEHVYRARQDSQILPLETILEKLDLADGTRLLEVEYEREHGIDVYEIEYLTPAGEIFEVEVDAATGRVLKQERE